ncbi:uncharacterized protein L199_006247 [Kwoniella botswanensis]|uniref:uncharacterized protein n=1 Tax=Kwoniella botswanensis TaxID=1268659 RepID=UPI00315D61B0
MPNHDSTRGYSTDAAATTVSDPTNTCICSNDDASTGRKSTSTSSSSDDDMCPFYFCPAFILAFLDVVHLVIRSVEDVEMQHFFNGMSIVFLSMAFALLLFHQPQPSNHAPICPYYRTKGWRNGESGYRAFLSIVLMITLAVLFWVMFGDSRPIEQSPCVLSNSIVQELKEAVKEGSNTQ